MKLRIGGAALAAAAILALAGCAHKSADAGSSSGNDALTKYRDCMSQNGVTLPSFAPRSGFPTVRPTNRPTVRPSGFPTARPSGGFGNGGGGFGGFGGFPQGIDASKLAAANQKCAALRPSGQPGFGNFGGNRPGGGGRNAAYRNCLMEHGVTLQDGQAPNASDPKVAAALKTCAVLRPTPTPTN
jgi:hypothetical protein